MINVLSGLALGIVLFAVTVGVGLVVLSKFGDTTAVCATDFTYNASAGVRACQNDTNVSDTVTPTNQAFTSLDTLMGSTNGLGALVTWVGAIIALVVGMLFIGALMGDRKY